MFSFRLFNPYSGDPMPPCAVPVDDSDPETNPPYNNDLTILENFTLEPIEVWID